MMYGVAVNAVERSCHLSAIMPARGYMQQVPGATKRQVEKPSSGVSPRPRNEVRGEPQHFVVEVMIRWVLRTGGPSWPASGRYAQPVAGHRH